MTEGLKKADFLSEKGNWCSELVKFRILNHSKKGTDCSCSSWFARSQVEEWFYNPSLLRAMHTELQSQFLHIPSNVFFGRCKNLKLSTSTSKQEDSTNPAHKNRFTNFRRIERQQLSCRDENFFQSKIQKLWKAENFKMYFQKMSVNYIRWPV